MTFPAQSPDLRRFPLVAGASRSVVRSPRSAAPRIRFLFVDSRVRFTLRSAYASRRTPCASLRSLRPGSGRTFTSKSSPMPGPPRASGGPSCDGPPLSFHRCIHLFEEQATQGVDTARGAIDVVREDAEEVVPEPTSLPTLVHRVLGLPNARPELLGERAAANDSKPVGRGAILLRCRGVGLDRDGLSRARRTRARDERDAGSSYAWVLQSFSGDFPERLIRSGDRPATPGTTSRKVALEW